MPGAARSQADRRKGRAPEARAGAVWWRGIPGRMAKGEAGMNRKLTLRINGEARALEVEPRVTLLDALREIWG